ncbi:MAG: hypothetical protein ACERKU_06465 [Nitrospirota bacterium]
MSGRFSGGAVSTGTGLLTGEVGRIPARGSNLRVPTIKQPPTAAQRRRSGLRHAGTRGSYPCRRTGRPVEFEDSLGRRTAPGEGASERLPSRLDPDGWLVRSMTDIVFNDSPAARNELRGQFESLCAIPFGLEPH